MNPMTMKFAVSTTGGYYFEVSSSDLCAAYREATRLAWLGYAIWGVPQGSRINRIKAMPPLRMPHVAPRTGDLLSAPIPYVHHALRPFSAL
jgi:hypothetical protein